ncbi:MAG TPA: hypothetical protein GX692_09620 [Acholeplasmataceae bacterium]|nr:hypothetical protein [Acholeplasmataceae bacterium]
MILNGSAIIKFKPEEISKNEWDKFLKKYNIDENEAIEKVKKTIIDEIKLYIDNIEAIDVNLKLNK